MIDRHCPDDRKIMLGADKGYDTADFVASLRAMNVTPSHAAPERERRRRPLM
jgi:hypothetical protein